MSNLNVQKSSTYQNSVYFEKYKGDDASEILVQQIPDRRLSAERRIQRIPLKLKRGESRRVGWNSRSKYIVVSLCLRHPSFNFWFNHLAYGPNFLLVHGDNENKGCMHDRRRRITSCGWGTNLDCTGGKIGPSHKSLYA